MNIKLADGLPFHPTKRHPHTGNRLRAVFVREDGSPVWPVLGASEDDDKGGDNKPDEDADKGDDDKGEKKPEKKDPNAERIAELEATIAQQRTHLSQSDSKKSAIEKELQALKDKDLPEIERLKKELEAEKADRGKASDVLSSLARTNAFLNASQKAKINWHDAEVAADQIKKADITIDENGVVTGMAEAVKKLVKDKPFLVDSGKKADDEEDEEGKKNGPSGSGLGSGGTKKKGDKTIDKDELRRKYSALRN